MKLGKTSASEKEQAADVRRADATKDPVFRGAVPPDALAAMEAELEAVRQKYAKPAAPPVEYPKYLRKRNEDGQVTDEIYVNDEAEARKLGAGWAS